MKQEATSSRHSREAIPAVHGGEHVNRVAVVGGGISGLAAAYRLRRLLGPAAEITVYESSVALGGKLRTVDMAGHPYELGAEAFLARRPEVPRLAEELGVASDIAAPSAAVSARIRAGGRSWAVPPGTAMGIPARAEGLADLLGVEAARRVASEPELAPLELGTDLALGELVRARFGPEVVERLVDPLLSGVYGGGADTLGVRATMPGLAAALDAGEGSLLRAAAATLPAPRPPDLPNPPVFGAFRSGYGFFIDTLTAATGALLRLGTPVRALARTGAAVPWRLDIGSAANAETVDADAVVLAVPAPAAAKLLAGVSPAASGAYAGVELASMAVVGLALPAGMMLPERSGTLVASGERHADGTPFTAKAFTFSSRKWPHLDGDNAVLRASVGRAGEPEVLRRDDADLVGDVLADLRELTGLPVQPGDLADVALVRWGGGIPQYGVGHVERVAAIERAVGDIPGLAVAGAALHGVGVPACLATAEAAATTLAADLGR